jgi:hypothetical protein
MARTERNFCIFVSFKQYMFVCNKRTLVGLRDAKLRCMHWRESLRVQFADARVKEQVLSPETVLKYESYFKVRISCDL